MMPIFKQGKLWFTDHYAKTLKEILTVRFLIAAFVTRLYSRFTKLHFKYRAGEVRLLKTAHKIRFENKITIFIRLAVFSSLHILSCKLYLFWRFLNTVIYNIWISHIGTSIIIIDIVIKTLLSFVSINGPNPINLNLDFSIGNVLEISGANYPWHCGRELSSVVY